MTLTDLYETADRLSSMAVRMQMSKIDAACRRVLDEAMATGAMRDEVDAVIVYWGADKWAARLK
jgi:hypothetical protein